MMDNTEKNELKDSVKVEIQPSPSLNHTETKSSSIPADSHPSPGQDDHELIDITTIKAEDVPTTTTTAAKAETILESAVYDKTDANATGVETAKRATSDAFIEDNPQTSFSSVPMHSTTNFEEIQNQLKKTLDHIEQRNMVSGFRTLSNATSAVVDHCEQLGNNVLPLSAHPYPFSSNFRPCFPGLTSDDHPYNAIDREQFWAGLNNCWLYALAQKHEPSCDDEKMTDDQLCKLRERVVTWADKLERFGLVDYEMGWWEADILAAMDAILATNYASAQAAAQAAMAKAAAALFGNETC
jgi:hypothetical protein